MEIKITVEVTDELKTVFGSLGATIKELSEKLEQLEKLDPAAVLESKPKSDNFKGFNRANGYI